MDVTCLFYADNNLIRATIGGAFYLTGAKTTFVQVLDEILQHKAKKVLIDGRTITGNPKAVERFFYGEFAAAAIAEVSERGLSHVPQFAYVLAEPVLDKHRLGETVAVNRGMNVKAFDNLDAAERWLGIELSNG
ncbi:MAG TPA: hypothetical protein VJM53_10435 [Burkholderiales bacterium]|jgi:hypothetical protein|nr:hypothetical protein [Burkholderiales bacterium]